MTVTIEDIMKFAEVLRAYFSMKLCGCQRLSGVSLSCCFLYYQQLPLVRRPVSEFSPYAHKSCSQCSSEVVLSMFATDLLSRGQCLV